MSNTPMGQGWWEASDGNWYPPDQHPGVLAGQSAPPIESPALASGSSGGKSRLWFLIGIPIAALVIVVAIVGSTHSSNGSGGGGGETSSGSYQSVCVNYEHQSDVASVQDGLETATSTPEENQTQCQCDWNYFKEHKELNAVPVIIAQMTNAANNDTSLEQTSADFECDGSTTPGDADLFGGNSGNTGDSGNSGFSSNS